jgi:hypothetical protein
VIGRLHEFPARVRDFLRARPGRAAAIRVDASGERPTLVALVGLHRLPRLLDRLGDEDEFLSPHGVRALSAVYRGHPFEIWGDGHVTSSVDYEPAESTTALFGGNSNRRGPVRFPVKYLLIGALMRYHQHLGDDYRIEYPRGSGQQRALAEVSLDLSERLVGIFLRDERGRRPVFGDLERFQSDPAWRDSLLFHEYFHGDNGSGLGASHQTGWTGLVADLIVRLGRVRAAAS